MATEGVSIPYERLGGVYSIATVIDDFIDRIMVDPRLNANPRVDEAHHRVSPGRLQIPRHRNGLLGHRRAARVHGPLDEGLPPTSDDHGNRMGSLSRVILVCRKIGNEHPEPAAAAARRPGPRAVCVGSRKSSPAIYIR